MDREALACCCPWCCKEPDMTDSVRWLLGLLHILCVSNYFKLIFTIKSYKISGIFVAIKNKPMAAAAPAAAKLLQSCPTLCDPTDCSLPGFSVHGILQARTLEWVAISFSKTRFKELKCTQTQSLSPSPSFLHLQKPVVTNRGEPCNKHLAAVMRLYIC